MGGVFVKNNNYVVERLDFSGVSVESVSTPETVPAGALESSTPDQLKRGVVKRLSATTALP